MRVGFQRHALTALPPGKTRYPLYRRLGMSQDRSRRVWKISPPPGFDPRTVQPVTSRFTDWAIPAHLLQMLQNHNLRLIVILRWMQMNCFVNCSNRKRLIKPTDRTEFKATNTIAKRKRDDKESEYITRHEIIFALYGSGWRCSLNRFKSTGYAIHQRV